MRGVKPHPQPLSKGRGEWYALLVYQLTSRPIDQLMSRPVDKLTRIAIHSATKHLA